MVKADRCYRGELKDNNARERWGQRNGSMVKTVLFMQKTRVRFPAPIPSDSQLPVTPGPENLTSASGLQGHNTYFHEPPCIYTIKKINFF